MCKQDRPYRVKRHGRAQTPNGANPQVANQSYAPANGHDKAFQYHLHDIFGGVRLILTVSSVFVSVILFIGTIVINYGFMTVPAKESDMKSVQTTLSEHTGSLKAITGTVDKIDRRLDHLEWEASSAPSSPKRSTTIREPKKDRD